MIKKITDKNGRDPFRNIRILPDQPLFKDCPVKPSEETIEAAEDLYLKFAYDPPNYISVKDEQIIFEWNHYKTDKLLRKHLSYSKELVIKDSINMEWRTFNYDLD